MTFSSLLSLFAPIAAVLHLLGVLSAVRAVMTARTPQGSIAWAISLITFPYLALPLYWIFGRDKFYGYRVARNDRDLKVRFLRDRETERAVLPMTEVDRSTVKIFEGLAHMRFRGGNEARLLIDGEETFKAIFAGIDSAKEYVLVQFYIVRDDGLGRALKERLIAAARRGVRVSFLYDDIGSYGLTKAYIEELTKASVDIRPFRNSRGNFRKRYQINFRNHRKIVVVDGHLAYVGGHNVGDEYLGKDPKLGFWRDTHVELRGPTVTQVQISFIEDWNWASNVLPIVNWDLSPVGDPGKTAMIIPSGPADKCDTCGHYYLEAINTARKRVWIASPYFVPDFPVTAALQLAALRGVDVRILLPSTTDSLLVYLASFSYLKDMLPWGVKMFRYEKGFLHQKVMLVDDVWSSVGTANFDNRSFRLNFEVTVMVADKKFNGEVGAMLEKDLSDSRPVALTDLTQKSFPYRLAVQIARLLAPIL